MSQIYLTEKAKDFHNLIIKGGLKPKQIERYFRQMRFAAGGAVEVNRINPNRVFYGSISWFLDNQTVAAADYVISAVLSPDLAGKYDMVFPTQNQIVITTDFLIESTLCVPSPQFFADVFIITPDSLSATGVIWDGYTCTYQ